MKSKRETHQQQCGNTDWQLATAKTNGEDDADEQENWAAYDEATTAALEAAFASGLQEGEQEQEGRGGGKSVATVVRRLVVAVDADWMLRRC